MPNQNIQAEAVPVSQAAARLGVSRQAVYLALQRGDIPAIVFGSRRLIPRQALEELLKGRRLRCAHHPDDQDDSDDNSQKRGRA